MESKKLSTDEKILKTLLYIEQQYKNERLENIDHVFKMRTMLLIITICSVIQTVFVIFLAAFVL